MNVEERPIPNGLDRLDALLARWDVPREIESGGVEAQTKWTRTSSGIEHSDKFLNETMRKAPLRRAVDVCEVGRTALVHTSDYTTAITGEVLYGDAGFHTEGMVFHRKENATCKSPILSAA